MESGAKLWQQFIPGICGGAGGNEGFFRYRYRWIGNGLASHTGGSFITNNIGTNPVWLLAQPLLPGADWELLPARSWFPAQPLAQGGGYQLL